MDMDTEYAYRVCLWEEGASARHAQLRPGPASGRGAIRRIAMPLPGDVVELVRIRAGALPAVERGDGGHVGLVELEVEDGEVFLDPAPVHRLREDDVPALHVPAQRDLRRAA